MTYVMCLGMDYDDIMIRIVTRVMAQHGPCV